MAVFPGGFGTFDEFFELLTLTRLARSPPVSCCRPRIWTRVVNLDALVEEGGLRRMTRLFHWCEDANEAWKFVQRFYEEHPAPAPVQSAPPE